MSSLQENQEGVLAKITCNWEIIKIESMGVDWIHLILDRDVYHDRLNTITNIHVPKV
jgi:hypothetical protein